MSPCCYTNNLLLFLFNIYLLSKWWKCDGYSLLCDTVVDLCLRHWASVVYIGFTRLHLRRWSRLLPGSTSSRQVAARRRSLTTPSVWSWWSRSCRRFASIISGPRLDTSRGTAAFLCSLSVTRVLLMIAIHLQNLRLWAGILLCCGVGRPTYFVGLTTKKQTYICSPGVATCLFYGFC